MEIFDIGGTELALIMLLAVIVLGPERLVVTARKFGVIVREVKAYFNSLTEELKIETDILEELKEVKNDLDDLK